ncbi:MAG: Bifunctional NAD(P)H-hydrate repair enzyme Nnr [Planctomycetota bacterium]|jgi:NAD(P)H-hydrate epimerase
MRSLTRAEVREVDRRAIQDFGLPGIALMENAGRGAAAVLHERAPRARVSIVCGKGNNAGDGFVIARHLANLGHEVRLLLACDPGDLRGDAALNWQVVDRMGLPAIRLDAAAQADWEEAIAGADWIVDALLGTGAVGPPRGAIATAIAAVNAVAARDGVHVLAVDLPSGLDCDSGLVAEPCIRADITATFVAPKVGFESPGAVAVLGAVRVVDIGAPGEGRRMANHR